MARPSTGDERVRALEEALADPEQRQRLVDFFAILIEWSLEETSQKVSEDYELPDRDSAAQVGQALLENGSTSLARRIG